MKRYLTILLLSLPLVLAAKKLDTLSSGVGLQLASQRSEYIDSIRYEIEFALNDRWTVRSGKLDIRFNVSRRMDVLLDFRNDSLLTVSANGIICKAKTENGHIVLPEKFIHIGNNTIQITFTPSKSAMNSRSDYCYTLLVPDKASMLFPCFDQPDMKARYKLRLVMPDMQSIAVSNGPVMSDTTDSQGRRVIEFAETEALPSYLFAFAAGRFEKQKFSTGKHPITIYYRETDSARIAQLKDIYSEVDYSLQWLEDYTGIPYPFAKYDLVILPGFQFGGMEHCGATFYNDYRIFLPPQPTQKEQLQRVQLIAHETAHMWFGDAVTMRWFNDVWMKEVFANLYAAKITEPLFTEIDHRLEFLRAYQRPAVEQDRTEGRTAIRQKLTTMNDASLIYNNIIYNKAPIMMQKLERMMGEDTFRHAMNVYLNNHMYGNADWHELVEILDSISDADVKAFAKQWVDMPYWPSRQANGWRDGCDTEYYGYTVLTSEQVDSIVNAFLSLENAAKMAALLTLHENFLSRLIAADRYMEILMKVLRCDNELVCITAIENMSEPLRMVPWYGARILETGLSHNMGSVRTSVWRLLTDVPTTDDVTNALYDKWLGFDMTDISEHDYMTMAYELAVRMPYVADAICSTQRARITNPDRLREFDFIAPAAYGTESLRDSLFFVSLQDPHNRKIETWVCRMLYYLNHPLRQEHALRYIYPSLEMLPEIHSTGAIFFTERWCKSLLKGHRSEKANHEVERFLENHADMNPLLLNKVKEAKYMLDGNNQREGSN